MTLYTESIADQTDHFANVFVRENVAYVYDVVQHYDVRKYKGNTILFREIQCKKMNNLMFQQRFQYELGWNEVKYARIMITHVCFIALTLAGSLRRCLNTRPIGLVFKQHPPDPANVNSWKNMCDPYTLSPYHPSGSTTKNFRKSKPMHLLPSLSPYHPGGSEQTAHWHWNQQRWTRMECSNRGGQTSCVPAPPCVGRQLRTASVSTAACWKYRGNLETFRSTSASDRLSHPAVAH